MRLTSELGTEIGGLSLRHPIMNASGILGYLPEHASIMVSWDVSAVVSKTFTREPREGYNPPIMVKIRGGNLINAVGLSNPGIEGLESFVSSVKRFGVPVIVSVGGRDTFEFVDVAIAAEASGSDAVELNMSCPHFEGGGIELGRDPAVVYNVVREVSSVIRIPVIVKLGIADRLVEAASKSLEAGAKALTLINTVRSMFIDVYTLKPVLSNVYGGLSGRSIHPVAVWAVYSVYRETSADIIGVGGVFTWRDAAEFILAGARAVQIGTALVYREGRIVNKILRGLRLWLKELGLSSIRDVIGASHRN